MRNAPKPLRYLSSAANALFAKCALATLLLAYATPATGQTPIAPSVAITPSMLTMLVNNSEDLSVVDQSGSPINDAQWSIRPPIAELSVENGEVTVHALRQGRAILTASTEYGSASATISILAETKLPPGTIQWSLEPMPGYESLMTVQGVPTGNSVVLYSI